MRLDSFATFAVAATVALAWGGVPAASAQEGRKGGAVERARTEVLTDLPAEYKALVGKGVADRPGFTVFFLQPGTNTIAQSVRAGQPFDMLVILTTSSSAEQQVTVRAFRLDLSGLGSGDVKVLPIVSGTAPDEEYWAAAPASPLRFPAGATAVRVSGIRVRRDAKQPPAGAASPFNPVDFPDSVIMFCELNGFTLAPTVRIAKP